MTSRERLLAVINGKMPDRAPIAPFIQQEFMADYLKRSDTDRLIDACICADELGFDLMTRQNCHTKPYFMKKSYKNWEVEESTVIENDNCFRITTIKTPEKIFKQVDGGPYKEDILAGIHFVTTEFMIENKSDFEIFTKYVPKMDDEHRQDIIVKGVFAKQHIGERGITVPWGCGGVFNLTCAFVNIQNILMDAIVDPEYYDAYMRFFAGVLAEDYAVFAKSDYDVVGTQGNMANGALMQENHFRQYILPYEKRAADVLTKANKPMLYHNCGCAANLLACYKDMGITIYETLAAVPQGDTILAEAKQVFSDTDIVLCGTFDQVTFLKTATEQEIFAKAAHTMATGKPDGKYIFAASDYIEQNTPIENFKAMIAGAKSTAKY